VESVAAKPPVPGGFQSLPQALMPRVQIGMGNRFDDTRRALTIVVGLQRLSALPIDTSVTSLDEAMSAPLPAILISAEQPTDQRISLPVAAHSDSEITVTDADGTGQEGKLKLDPSLRFGSLQTTFDGNRTVVIATSNKAPDQLDDLLRWLDSDVEHWSRLTGDALIATPGHAPVMVGTAHSAPQQVVESKSLSVPWWSVGAGAGIAVVIVLAAGLIMLRGRRSRAQP